MIDFIRLTLTTAAVALLIFMSQVAQGQKDGAPLPDQVRAAAALEQDLKTDPNNAALWLHLGFSYRKLEKIDQSKAAFEKVIALNPNEKDAYFMLGLIYESQHNDEAAQTTWKKYLTLENDANRRALAEKHIHHLTQ